MKVQNIINILTETVRPNYLYHSTTVSNALDIIDDQSIKPKKSWGGKNDIPIVSMSRNSKLFYNNENYNNPEVQFVFDRDVLKMHFHSPTPTNWMKDSIYPYGSIPNELQSMNKNKAWEHKNKYEREEYLTKPIPTSPKFIEKIVIYQSAIQQKLDSLDEDFPNYYHIKKRMERELAEDIPLLIDKINFLKIPLEII